MLHDAGCGCWKCLAQVLGAWVDVQAPRTEPGRWQVFGTTTFRTPDYPWKKGFPMLSPRPSPLFGSHLFSSMVDHLEHELSARVDYVVADQLGALGGRFHQHWILAAEGLGDYPRKAIWKWLWDRAGWNRVLPFEHGAAYYIGRYIGRDVTRCEWDLRIGDRGATLPVPLPIGRTEIVRSADLPRNEFHKTVNAWHR
jgi:hypothetical protein